MVFHDVEYQIFRNITVLEKTRADGRAMDEIRPLSTDIDLLQGVVVVHYLQGDRHKV